ncbi:hypothetical protein SBRCBS47491_001317 [Sporothrix bragantina]|uniref:Uncharacterized protein n=1 Tax=Sporothrix bragantina TaxID=671064 RepID=A0ABP0AXK3_9PEZI
MFPTEYPEDVEMCQEEAAEMGLNENENMSEYMDRYMTENENETLYMAMDVDSDEEAMRISTDGIEVLSVEDMAVDNQDIEMTIEADIDDADEIMEVYEWLESLPTSLGRFDKSSISLPWEEQVKGQKPPAPMFYSTLYNHYYHRIAENFSWEYKYGRQW